MRTALICSAVFAGILTTMAAAAGPAWAGDSAAAEPIDRPLFELEAAIDEGAHRVTGQGVLRSLRGEEAVLWLPAMRYREPDGLQNNLIRNRVYPDFLSSTGDMRLLRVERCDASGLCDEVAAQALPVPEHLPWLPAGSRLRIAAPQRSAAASPNAATHQAPPWELRLSWEVDVPNRYGPFGWVGEHVTLNGAWTPLLEAPRSELSVRDPATAAENDDEVEAGRSPEALDALMPALELMDWAVTIRAPGGRVLLLHNTVQAKRTDGAEHEHRVRVAARPWLTAALRPADRAFYPRGSSRRDAWREQRLTAVRRAARITLEELGLTLPPDIVVIEAPLRRTLTEPASGGLMISDRALEILPLVRNFHERSLLRAWLEAALRHHLWQNGSNEAVFLAELAAEPLFPRALKSGVGKGILADELLENLMWLPDVDALLYASTAPFSGEVLNNPYVDDALRADVSRMFRSGYRGQPAFARLMDRYGEEAVNDAVDAGLAGLAAGEPGALLRAVAELDGEGAVATDPSRSALALLDRVRRRAPPTNFVLEDWERERADGGWRTRVSIRREVVTEDEPFVDPLPEQVGVKLRGGGEEQRAVWAATDGEGQVELRSDRRPRYALLDPDYRLIEGDGSGFLLRGDNRKPVRIRPSFYALPLELDLTQGTFAARAGAWIKRDFANRYTAWVDLYHDDRRIVDLAVGHDFGLGAARTGVSRKHRLRLITSGTLGGTRFREPEGVSAAVTLSWRYTDLVGDAFALNGLTVNVGVSPGWEFPVQKRIEGGPFVSMWAGAAWLMPLSARQVLAANVEVGWSGGGGVQNRRSLGGQWGLRGLSALQELGDATALVQLELRNLVVKDGHLFTLGGPMRAFEVILFVDAGLITDRLEEAPRFHVGPGFGMRAHIDSLGLQPVVGGIDIAWSPTAGQGNFLPIPLQIYFTAGRVF